MKFTLSISGAFYDTESKEQLETLGFKFTRDGNRWYCGERWDNEIEIKSLEDLIDFVHKWGEIVFDENHIEIYNDYRE